MFQNHQIEFGFLFQKHPNFVIKTQLIPSLHKHPPSQSQQASLFFNRLLTASDNHIVIPIVKGFQHLLQRSLTFSCFSISNSPSAPPFIFISLTTLYSHHPPTLDLSTIHQVQFWLLLLFFREFLLYAKKNQVICAPLCISLLL